MGVAAGEGDGGTGLTWVKWWYLIAVMLVVLGMTTKATGSEAPRPIDSLLIVNQVEFESWQQFTHLAINKNTGNVYAGGVNRIYLMDPNLFQLQQVETGPVNDSAECTPSDCRGVTSDSMKVTNNVNKVLLIDYMRSRLIVCSTIRQGPCQVRDLHNITNLNHDVNEAIVANSATASTVAFIGPGPPRNPYTDLGTPNLPATSVLYIGVTYTGMHVERSTVPAVASRSLDDDNLFNIAFSEVTTASRMFVNSLIRERYLITYVYGFSSEKFSYFLTRQREHIHTGSPYMSKLVRVCQEDPSYYSYTEIPIQCKDSLGKNYNLAQAAYVGKPGSDLANELDIGTMDDVLFVVFSSSDLTKGRGLPRPAQVSALCVYSMKSVRQMFLNNIQECFKGNGTTNLNFIRASQTCIPINMNITEDFCGLNVNTPLGGNTPVEGLAILTFPTELTAVAATSTDVYTVVFLGTAQGHLKKVVLQNQNSAEEYDDIIVDEDSPIRQDMHFDKDGDHLYVMSNNKISKVRAQECSIYKNCIQCLEARDSSCGWCPLEHKCSLQKDCQVATEDSERWMNNNTGHCPSIIQVVPDKLQYTVARTLSLMIDNMPSVEGSFQCVFSYINRADLITKALRTAQGVTCTTPRNDFLPDIPYNEHHITTTLSVRQSEGPEFVSTNFTFFNCNTFSSCTECVSSPFPCDWCVDGYRCTHDTAEYCRNDILVNGINRVGPSIRSGPSFCPRITFMESPEFIIPIGTEKSLQVKVDNIAQFITQTRFVCQFNIEGRVTSVNANLLSDTIYCDLMDFVYSTPAPLVNATFAVIWGGSKPLDNPDNIHVVIYQCGLMADNCGMCLSLPERYNRCGWCESDDQCEIQDQCYGTSWLDQEHICPNTNITDVYPRNGTWNGSTSVTIEDTTISYGENNSTVLNADTRAGNITISKVRAQECSIYESCIQCLEASDPFCGWCPVDYKCSLQKDCQVATQDSQHWISNNIDHCPTIIQVMPDKLQITSSRTLSLMIDNMPSVEGSFQCVFSYINRVHLISKATRTAQGVTCTTPRTDFLPDIPHNEHHVTTKLSVRKFEGPEFVSTNFTFFNCNTFRSCTECVSSPFPCDWCVDGHRCTHDSAENCRNDVLVNGVNRVGPSIRSGPSFCPRIAFMDSQEFLVPFGTEKSLKIKVDNILQFITQSRFVCQFIIEGRATSVIADLLSDTIYCDLMEFVYSTPAPSINATFAVIWGGSKPLDNPYNIQILMYQCGLMADNCGMCLSLPERYRCGWCQSTHRCEVQDQCSGRSWLDQEHVCPNMPQ